MNLIGYLRVSTEKQKKRGWGIAAQRTALSDYEARTGHKIIHVEKDEAKSGKSFDNREGLLRAMELCKQGFADGIVIAKLDRLIRSMDDYYAMLRDAKRDGYSIVALDFEALDPENPMTEFMQGVGALQAQFERRIISIRTRDAMAELKAAGVHVGRPRTYTDQAMREKARRCKAEGYTVSQTQNILHSTFGTTASRTTVARMMRDDSIPLPDIAREALERMAVT